MLLYVSNRGWADGDPGALHSFNGPRMSGEIVTACQKRLTSFATYASCPAGYLEILHSTSAVFQSRDQFKIPSTRNAMPTNQPILVATHAFSLEMGNISALRHAQVLNIAS